MAIIAPTKTALQKHPQAVVLLGYVAAKPTVINYRDFEWFDTDAARTTFLAECLVYVNKDVTDHGDLYHLVAEVLDTSNMTLGQVHAIGGSAAQKKERIASILGDPNLLVQPRKAGAKAPAASAPKAKGARAKVSKGRKPSTAADAVKGPIAAGDEPKPRAKKVLKRNAAAPAAQPSLTGEERAAALQKRLDAKKAAAPKVAADAEPSLVNALQWAIPLGRKAKNGRFARLV